MGVHADISLHISQYNIDEHSDLHVMPAEEIVLPLPPQLEPIGTPPPPPKPVIKVSLSKWNYRRYHDIEWYADTSDTVLPGPSFYWITVRTLIGTEIKLAVEANWKIAKVKERVEEKEGIPPAQQRLITGGKQANDEKTLEEVCERRFVPFNG